MLESTHWTAGHILQPHKIHDYQILVLYIYQCDKNILNHICANRLRLFVFLAKKYMCNFKLSLLCTIRILLAIYCVVYSMQGGGGRRGRGGGEGRGRRACVGIEFHYA